jgi:hypothetical protein
MIEITDEMIQTVNSFLGEEGKNFFRELRDEYKGDSAFPGAWAISVHHSYGRAVRNALYSTGKYNVNLDDYWIPIVEKVLKI